MHHLYGVLVDHGHVGVVIHVEGALGDRSVSLAVHVDGVGYGTLAVFVDVLLFHVVQRWRMNVTGGRQAKRRTPGGQRHQTCVWWRHHVQILLLAFMEGRRIPYSPFKRLGVLSVGVRMHCKINNN